ISTSWWPSTARTRRPAVPSPSRASTTSPTTTGTPLGGRPASSSSPRPTPRSAIRACWATSAATSPTACAGCIRTRTERLAFMRRRAAALLLALAPPAGRAEAAPPPATIQRLAADAAGLFANAYLVETPTGVVVIDGRLLTSEGKAVRTQVQALHKPLLAVL